MPELKLVINSKDGKSYSKTLPDSSQLIGRKLGDEVKGELLGLTGYELKITGGSDDSGFPMRSEISMAGKKKIYAEKGIGIKTKYKGNFIRRTVAGNSVYQKTAQLNLAVTKPGKKTLEEIFGKKEEAQPQQKE